VPDFDDLAFNIFMIVDAMALSFSQELYYILLLIFRNYQKEFIKIGSVHKIAINVLNNLEQCFSQRNNLSGVVNYF